jgi:hypothetical protein
MWVVQYLIPKLNGDEVTAEIDFDEELRKRLERERGKQRIGIRGEKYVFELEKEFLLSAGHKKLAERVRLISADDEGAGYDVLSFTTSGKEKHIEVKSTAQSKNAFDRFWISDNELKTGMSDPDWTVYRVWRADTDPYHEVLGNVVTMEMDDWERDTAAWVIRRKA